MTASPRQTTGCRTSSPTRLATTISLDGSMAAPNDEADWVLAYTERSEAAHHVIDTTGPGRCRKNVVVTGGTDPVTLETREVAAGELIDMRFRVVSTASTAWWTRA